MDADLPNTISFVNEKGVLMEQPIHYEWRPVVCNRCKKMGHSEKSCFKVQQKVCKPKQMARRVLQQTSEEIIEADISERQQAVQEGEMK